ncbi:MAG: putative metal-binding motif-containing protein [Myxococcota bacterium]
MSPLETAAGSGARYPRVVRTSLLLVWSLVVLGCSGWFGPPQITRFDVVEAGCGSWSATVEVADARAHTVRVRRGAEVLGTWPDVWGTHTLQVEGEAALGEPIELTAEIADVTERTVPFRAEVAAFEVVGDRPAWEVGASPRFELRVDPGCATRGLRYRAASESWDGQGPVRGAVTPITLPPHREGVHPLQVELLGPAGPVGTTTTRFAVGDASDLDGDGFEAGADCDDGDATVGPDQQERPDPNGKDDNCDGRVDEGTVAYDDDGDGSSEDAGDCDDRDPRVRPGAAERADCRDNDCDGQVDEGQALGRADDGYERPGGEPYLFPGTERRLRAELVLVSRDAADAEVVRFWSDDGDWDEWRIEVIAARVPADSVYEVEIREAGGAVVAGGTLGADGDVVRTSGRAFRDDSGLYDVSIRPTRLYAPYCPIELTIDSR